MAEFFNRQWRLPNNENKDKQSNYSMDFDSASSDYIAASVSELNSASTFTISAWIKKPTSSSSIVLGNRISTYKGVWFSWYLDGNVYFQVRGSNQSIIYPLTFDTDWHHIVGTFNNGVGKLYIEGSNVSTFTFSTTTTPPTTGDGFRIGSIDSTFFSDGSIDEVGIWNTALSSSQVTTLYGSSSTGIGNPMSLSPKPVAYYPLGDQDVYNSASYLVPNASLQDYVFDFNSDYVTLNSSINLNGNKTVSYWVNPNALNGNIYIGGVAPNYYTYMTSTQLAIKDSTGFSSFTISISTGNWYHICITGDGTNATLYINGDIIGTAADKNPTIETIGAYSGGGGAINAKMSNVQIFNTALPATGSNSVETLYNNGSPLTSMSGFTSLQGWWKLDASATYDGSNWTIEDSSSNSNDGTSSGMTQANLVQSDLSFTSGYSPYALELDGTSNFIDCGNDSTLNIYNNITISAWIKADSFGAYNLIIGRSTDKDYDLGVYSTASGGAMRFHTGDGTQENVVSTGTFLNTGVWYHVAVTRTTSPNQAIFFINGQQLNTAALSLTPTGSTDITRIGGRSGSYGFAGSMSNCSVWNTALTSTQVTEIYSEGIPQNLNNHSAYSNLVSWWQLGSNSSFNSNSWTVLDEKGTNDGVSSTNMSEVDIVNGVGYSSNGVSSGMSDNVVGDAPYSTANSLSVNMDVLDRTTDTPS